jgi:hypothetical protein
MQRRIRTPVQVQGEENDEDYDDEEEYLSL